VKAENASCPFCEQANETIQHLDLMCAHLASMVFCPTDRIQEVTARPETAVFSGWWYGALKTVNKQHKKGPNSLIILVAWELWKHHNGCVQWIHPMLVWF